jgi:selenide,water dikinase
VIDDVGADASAPPSGPEKKSHGKPSAKRGGALRKSGMQAGELLILTKPIGTGTLLAAHARGQARGRWIDAALDCMTLSNQAAAQQLRQHGASACTDLTGFGLAGHVLEMANASAMGVELQLDALPLLEGASACVQAGISSSLQSANVRAEQAIENASAFQADARYPLLFDPQTAGGLLASVPAANAQACLAALHAAGYTQACVIGNVVGSVAGQVMRQVIDSGLAPQDRNAPASHAAKRIRLGPLSAGLSGLAS